MADLYLENLLQMQARLEAAERTFLQSQIRFCLADSSLRRAVSALHPMASSPQDVPDPNRTADATHAVASSINHHNLDLVSRPSSSAVVRTSNGHDNGSH
ncbi:MAG: hypothetical protein ABGZ35_00110 [Planctomycetaceae bacterium]